MKHENITFDTDDVDIATPAEAELFQRCVSFVIVLNCKILVQIMSLAWKNGASTSRQCDVAGKGWVR